MTLNEIHTALHKSLGHQEILQIISGVSADTKIECYLVGGFMRDVILARQSNDIDFVVIGDGIFFAQKLAQKLNVKVNVFKNFGTAMIKYKGFEIEFVGARKESYIETSRKPTIEKGTLIDDLSRRDFTINTLALSFSKDNLGTIVDMFEGKKDIENKIIRTPKDPVKTFSDDPLRMLRAIRFSSQLNFEIEDSTWQAIRSQSKRLNIISKERISDELNKIILSPKPSVGFKLLFSSGLLSLILPDMIKLAGVEVRNSISHKDNFLHTLEVLDNIATTSDDLWLRWAAILHDIAKPATKRFNNKVGWTFHGHEYKGAKMVPKIFNSLKLPMNHKMVFVEKMVALHLRPIALVNSAVTDSAIRRLLFDAGDDIDSLLTLCNADITTKSEYKKKKYRQNFDLVKDKIVKVEERDKIRNWQPPISGEDIMKVFNLKPCKKIGIIKQEIKEAILEGIIPNEREAAEDFMKNKFKELLPLH